MKKKKQKGLTAEQYFKDVPNIVLSVQINTHLGLPVSASTYEEAITKHPEYFPEEVEYRKKWTRVPQPIKDNYFAKASLYRLSLTDEEEKERDELFGKCPHPDIQGCGIIDRVTTYSDRGKDFAENDAWNAKCIRHQHKKDVDLYNELFNPYGLSRTYED